MTKCHGCHNHCGPQVTVINTGGNRGQCGPTGMPGGPCGRTGGPQQAVGNALLGAGLGKLLNNNPCDDRAGASLLQAGLGLSSQGGNRCGMGFGGGGGFGGGIAGAAVNIVAGGFSGGFAGGFGGGGFGGGLY